MKTLLKRAATLTWFCAVVVLGSGTLVFAVGATVRALTPPSMHEKIVTIDGGLHFQHELRRPTMFNTINGMGIDPDFLALATGMAFVAVFLGACIVPWWYVRRSPAGEPEDCRGMQELHRLAERLTDRLDSLEAILLDPARQAPEWERDHL